MVSHVLGRQVVNVINLGRMGYMRAIDIQNRYKRLHLDEIEGKPVQGHNILLLVEHNPVYTVGIRSDDYTEEDEDRLRALGAEFYHTKRGGLITFHGPGQLVAYPVLNLSHFLSRPSLPWYVSALENTIVNTCKKFGITAQPSSTNRGVWVQDRKIAAIGVSRSRKITTHGCSINCNTDLSWFKHIIPCGIKGKDVTSLSKELANNVTVDDAISPFLTSFQESFDCDLEFSFMETDELEISMRHQSSGQTPMDTAGMVNSGVASVRMMSSMAYPSKKEKNV